MSRLVKAFFIVSCFTCLPVLAAGDADQSAKQAAELFRSDQFTASREIFAELVKGHGLSESEWTRENGINLFNLGATCAATGDLAEAALAFRGALAVFEKLEQQDDLDTALALEGLASVLLQQENLEEAQECLDRAMAVRQARYPEGHPQLARLYALGATAAQLRGDVEGTEELYYQALMAYRKIHGNIHPIVAEIIQNIGTFYTDNGNFQAEIMFIQAAEVGKRLYGPWHPVRAASLTNFGRLRWTEGRFAEAEEYLREALSIHDHLGGQSSPALSVCLYHLGRVLAAQDRFTEAVEVLDRAAAVYESAWWRAGAGAERSLSVMSPYPLLAAANLELGRTEEALKAFNAHQGRLAALSGRLRDLPRDLAVQRDGLVRELDLQERELARLEAASQEGDRPAPDENRLRDERALARARLAQAETAWLAFQSKLSENLAHGAGLTSADFRRNLAPGEAALGWLSAETRPGESQAWALVLRKDQELTWGRLPGLDVLPGELARDALAEVTGGVPGPALDALRQTVMAPLAEPLKGSSGLLVVPSSFMAGFPVELLLDEGRQLAYVPFLPRSPYHDEQDGSLKGARVLVVADPPFSRDPNRQAAAAVNRSLPGPTVLRSVLAGNRRAIENLPPLAGTRQEAEVLARLYPATTSLLGDQASESALRHLAEDNDLAGFDIIHLATHALIDAERPTRSALVLSQLDQEGYPDRDGLLTVQEIGRSWKLDSELVTLSACATGLGRRIDGEGFLGFTQTLMGAGARNVLVSLWPVDDQATALLMERFYTNLAQGTAANPAQALGQARRWLRDYTTPVGSRPFEDPRYWAGFVIFCQRD
jgi:tetratricopeptide (TPR) repeat protein